MDPSTQRFVGTLIFLAINTAVIAGMGWGIWRAMRRRLAILDHRLTTGDREVRAMDERVRQLEAGQEAMRREQVAQRELLNRINSRLGRQTVMLHEIQTGAAIADAVEARVSSVLLPRLLGQAPGTRVDIGQVRSERDAHLGSTFTRHEGD